MDTYNQDRKRDKIENAIIEQNQRMKRFNHLLKEMNQLGGNNSSFNTFVHYNEMNNLKSSTNKSRTVNNINEQIQYLETNIQKLHKNEYKCREATHEKKRLINLKNNLLKNK